VRILNYLRAEGIEPDFEASTKEEVLRKLAAKAVSIADGIDAGEIFDILLEREGLGSTGIGNGIAIPHGKIPGLKRLCLLVARCREGVPFDSMDSLPVHVVVLLLAPDDATTAYLRVLARVSRVLKIKGLMDRIKNAADAAEIKQVIGEAENRL
jgi:PTS system nitrogen regulatory IIA component